MLDLSVSFYFYSMVYGYESVRSHWQPPNPPRPSVPRVPERRGFPWPARRALSSPRCRRDHRSEARGISDRLRQADRRAFARAELRRKIPSCRRIWMPFEPCRSRREPFANRQRRRAPAEFRTNDFGNEHATKKTRQNVDDFDQTR